MAVSGSGMFVNQWIGWLSGLQVVDFVGAPKVALFTNTITPDFSASTANARYGVGAFATGEVTGTAYTAGGILLPNAVLDESPSGVLRYTSDDVSWGPGSVITDARCALIYDSSGATPVNAAIILVDFGADYSTNGGTFTIQWADEGIYNLDLVP